MTEIQLFLGHAQTHTTTFHIRNNEYMVWCWCCCCCLLPCTKTSIQARRKYSSWEACKNSVWRISWSDRRCYSHIRANRKCNAGARETWSDCWRYAYRQRTHTHSHTRERHRTLSNSRRDCVREVRQVFSVACHCWNFCQLPRQNARLHTHTSARWWRGERQRSARALVKEPHLYFPTSGCDGHVGMVVNVWIHCSPATLAAAAAYPRQRVFRRNLNTRLHSIPCE